MTSEQLLWSPSEAQQRRTPLHAFITWCADRHGSPVAYDDFHAWSVAEPEKFWSSVWTFCGVKGDPGSSVLTDGADMLAARFFPDASLNFAENLLSRRGDADAILFRGEDKARDRWSWDRLRAEVSRIQQALRALDIREGDRIAAMMPNMPETVALMLAAVSIGAVWSSCSPDF